VSDPNHEYQTLTDAVRNGEVPWTGQGYRSAREVVRRARSGELRLPAGIAGLPAEVIAEAGVEDLALGLWLRREHQGDSPEVPAAHHLRFHTIERFLATHADLLLEEGLLRPGDDESAPPDPDPLLVEELVTRPYDSPLSGEDSPGFDAGAVLKAVARRARGGE
jgi:hypothetical protein